MNRVTAIRQAAKRQAGSLARSTLLMNAFYLMLATVVIALSGFVFWAIVTRSYDAAAVGLATTMLSVSGLLSLLGLVGFDATLLRFLPRATQKSDHVSASLIAVGISSTVLALAAAIILPYITPELASLQEPAVLVAFVFFTAVTALNTLTNAVFLAYKQALYILIINSLFGGCKIVLPLLLVKGNATTIFVMAGIAQLAGLLLSLRWMKHRFDFRFSLRLNRGVLRDMKKFSASMYAASVLNLLPPTLLPLLILSSLNAQNAAYYYMAFTLATALYTIAYAAMQSAFAEGSHDEAAVRSHVVKAAKLISILLLPAALVTVLLSKSLLGLFGPEYARYGGDLLKLFAIGAIPVAIYSALGVVFKVTKQLRAIVVMNVVYALTILGLGAIWVSDYRLMGVGAAWVIGNTAACAAGGYFLIKTKGAQRG